MGFLNISASLQTLLVAGTHLADGELLQVAVNGEEIIKWRGRPRIIGAAKRDGQHFKPE
jgi:hypothetical protein